MVLVAVFVSIVARMKTKIPTIPCTFCDGTGRVKEHATDLGQKESQSQDGTTLDVVYPGKLLTEDQLKEIRVDAQEPGVPGYAFRINIALLLGHIQALERDESPVFLRGVNSVLKIRCLKHGDVPQYNRNESSGAECPACELASAHEKGRREERESLIAVLEKHISPVENGWNNAMATVLKLLRKREAAERGPGEGPLSEPLDC